MPEFLQDPSVLTKDKLKSELVANSVSLPAGEQRKEVYVKLYLQHLTSRNRGTPDFSSDEEREATPMRGRGRPPGRKATKKTDKPSVEEKPEQDVTELTNEALKEELLKYGITHGPILANTRKLYEKKVIKAKEQVTSITSVADTSNTDSNKQNGNSDPEQYSDNEESKIDLTFETREPIRGKSKAQVTSRSRRLEQNEIVEKTFTEEKREDRNVLKEMFPYETLTPTGISATCRRPIKGAAGRPFSMKDYKIEEGYTSKYVSKYQQVHEQKVTKPKTGRSIPMWIKILIFVVLAVFLFLVYQVMETNEGNPFSVFQQVTQSSNKVEN
ncbi:thymopoietin isoform X2 [Aquarana catesbeiana]|uniref:thymopoietin isoform X2 n=1 Tax=Aquarana catesbeiana TaxID=8400 RepID=UPI003CC9FF63